MMKIIIDPGKVDKNFKDSFPDVGKALFAGRCVAYTGGSKFKSELTEAGRRYFLALEKAGRTKKLPDAMVDAETGKIEAIFRRHSKCHRTTQNSKKPCDDPHLFAIASLAETKHFVTGDKRILACYKCIKDDKGRYTRLRKPRVLTSNNECKKVGIS